MGAAGAVPGHLQDASEEIEDGDGPQEAIVGAHDQGARALQLAQAGFEPPCLQKQRSNKGKGAWRVAQLTFDSCSEPDC